jgi:isoquinoline 1-oxidoreductase alpha subunit
VPRYSLNVNGKLHAIEAPADMPVLWALRDLIGLTGTKYGCGEGICGACTVHQDGRAVRSCQLTVAQVGKSKLTTIEGLDAGGAHPCQRAWLAEDVAQCGYCQPGMIMETAALLKTTPRPSDEDIDRELGSHVCRCGTYQRIRKAVHLAAEVRK